MESRYALVLTGSTLPGYAPENVWPALAAYFRMEPAKLTDQVLVRAPLTIKESEDLGKLQTLQAGAAAVGAEAEICAPDGRPALFVLLDGTPRGPVPRVFVEERIEHGLWPDRLMIAEVGASTWQSFRDMSPPPPVAPTEEVADEPDIATASARPAGYAPTMPADHGHNLAGIAATASADTTAAAGVLPAGPAIHAGFWRRGAAYFMDGFIVGVIGWIAGMVLLLGLAFSGSISAVITGVMLNYAVVMIIYWLYFALQESSATQATLGKRAMGIKVTDERGGRISFARATGRFFGKILSALVANIGFMLAGWTERKQALHDFLASTLVVFRDVRPGEPLPTVRPPMPWYGWLVNILCLALIPIGIMAAIAIPAYQEYISRAQAATGTAAADAAKMAVAAFYAGNDRCPDSGDEAGFDAANFGAVPYVSQVAIEPECRVVVTFAGTNAVNAMLRGQRIQMQATPDASGSRAWTCSASVPNRLLPGCSE